MILEFTKSFHDYLQDEREMDKDENNEQSKDSVLMERLKFQEAEIARLSELYEELQAKRQECEELKKQLTVSAVTQGNRVRKFMHPQIPVYYSNKCVHLKDIDSSHGNFVLKRIIQ